MIQIRNNIFETNSSSVHTLTLCSQEDFNKWKQGKLIWDWSSEELIEPDLIDKYDEFYDEEDYLTYEDFFDGYSNPHVEYMETYTEHKNVDGKDVVAFGYFGHD